MQKSISKKVQFQEGEGTIHAFSTGSVSVKNRFRSAKGNTFFSKLHIFLDRQFTEFIPIWVWVIDHPEGVFVIDTGENAKVLEPDYFKAEGPIANFMNTRLIQFQIEPEEEVGPQLKRLGYEQKDLKQVVLTHMHLDHFDGLRYFEKTPVVVSRYEWENQQFPMPTLLPEWLEPELVNLVDEKGGPFPKSYPLTKSGELQLVHTPGHTKGHCSVLVQTKELDYLLAGDVTYTEEQLIQQQNSGAHQSFSLSRKSFAAIRQYAAQHRLVYLPSHDADALSRIEESSYLQ